MTSTALKRWHGDRQRALEEIEAAHRSVGGSGPGRRYATLQVNYAFAMLLSSQFQGFCRDLHSEAADFLARRVQPPGIARVVRALLTEGRRLDHGNPNAGNIGSDFGRLGIELWPKVLALGARNKKRQQHLQTLNEWRNGIAHQDFSRVPGGPRLLLGTVRTWRAALDGLARAFDDSVQAHLTGLVQTVPW